MRQQDDEEGCGPTSLSNYLEARHGVRTLTKEACATICKTDYTGTDERRMRAALKSLGETPVTIRSYAELIGRLVQGHPVMLVVDKDTHWVCAIGMLGTTVIVADPATTTEAHTKARLMERWTSESGRCYGISGDPG